MDTTNEELAVEQAATQLPKEEEVRAKVIEEFGFDEEADAEKINKIVAKDMEARKKLSDAIGQKVNYRNLLNEEKRKTPPVPTEPKSDNSLSSQDILALVEVPEEDREEVIRTAKVLGKSIQEARKDDVVKNILSTRLEHRKSADAANTTPSRRGSGKVSDETLLEQFSKGEIPEPGTEEAERLFFLRRKAK